MFYTCRGGVAAHTRHASVHVKHMDPYNREQNELVHSLRSRVSVWWWQEHCVSPAERVNLLFYVFFALFWGFLLWGGCLIWCFVLLYCWYQTIPNTSFYMMDWKKKAQKEQKKHKTIWQNVKKEEVVQVGFTCSVSFCFADIHLHFGPLEVLTYTP